MTAIYSLLSAAKTQEKNLETTANNIANVNTTGFKSNKTVFKEFLKHSSTVGNPNNDEQFIHNNQSQKSTIGNTRYAVVNDTANDMSSGGFQKTDNPLDLAIKGDGFFNIDTPFGRRFTRDGEFTRAADGYLTDINGNYVLGTNGRIDINGTKINITPEGLVSVDGLFIDQLLISDFENSNQLTKVGDNYFIPSKNQQLKSITNFTINQGMIEKSNVSLINEMTNLINTNRMFDAVQRGIRTMDDINEQSLRLAR